MKYLAHTSVYYQVNIAITADNLERIFDVLLRLYLILGTAFFLAQKVEIAVYWLADWVQSIEYTMKMFQVVFNSIRFAILGG